MLCIIERGRQQRGHLVKSRRLVLRFPRSPALKVHLCSEYVIISLNIKSVLQPTAAKFKGSLVWWPRAWLTLTNHTHPTHIHTLDPLSLTVQLCQFGPRADWSQEGATFLKSWEDWVTQSPHQDTHATRLCRLFFFFSLTPQNSPE